MSVVKRWSPVGPADGEVEDARLDGPGMRLGVLLASLPAGTVTSTAIAWPDFRSSDSDASRSRRIA
jgi:hypothetical protein